MKKQWFTLGVAENCAFCNRQNERKKLTDNILTGRHTVIMSPRRYGKTSLALNVAHTSKQAFGQTDFMAIADTLSAKKMICNAASQAMLNIQPNYKKILSKISQLLKTVSVKLSLDQYGPKLEFGTSDQPAEDIVSVLSALDKLATQENKRAILLFDEFQQIGLLKEAKSLEGAIRHVAQQTKNSSYIFSGSNRHLLQTIFHDSHRPLYHLCDHMTLERIHEADYIPFINKAAQETWQTELDVARIKQILTLTKRHSYYVNALCAPLWLNTTPPTEESIQNTWHQYAKQEMSRIAGEIASLSLNQRAILNALAKQPSKTPSSQAYLSFARLSSASAVQAIKTLLAKDLIFRDDENYLRILDPAMEYVLNLVDIAAF